MITGSRVTLFPLSTSKLLAKETEAAGAGIQALKDVKERALKAFEILKEGFPSDATHQSLGGSFGFNFFLH